MTDTSVPHDAATQQMNARLAEATAAVSALQQRLEALIEAEENDRINSQTLNEATAQLQDYISQIHDVTETARSVLPDLQSALQQAEAFLAATDLSRVVAELAETRELIRLALDDRVGAAELQRDIAQQQLELIRDKAARLPERHRRSLGVS